MSSQDRADEGLGGPRFTLNAFMRYLSAGATGRHSIVQQQKHPSRYQEVYYDAAADVLRRFIADGMGDATILEAGMAAIAESAADEDVPHNVRANVEVVQAFRDRRPRLHFGGLAPSPTSGPPSSLFVAGVELVIRPEILLEGVVDGERRGGALKFYYSKGHPLTGSAASYGALLLRRYCEANLPGDAVVPNRLCIICDVRAGEVHTAPEATVRRDREIEAACAEIALRWPSA